MTVLPVLIFITGVVFLILGWRWQNPPSKEILTVLKGMAHIKREINRLEEDLNTLDKKVDSQLVQLKLNIETSVTKASSDVSVHRTLTPKPQLSKDDLTAEGGFRPSLLSQKEHFAAKVESTPTEAEHGFPLPLIEVGVLEVDKENHLQENRSVKKTVLDPRLSVYRENNTVVVERDGQAFNTVNSGNLNSNHKWDTLPEKYRRILELAKYDLTVSEISKRLGISQDAVMMVVRTHQRGGKA
ncbi:MAG: hypothetical protein ACYDEJ_02355 [Desulfitobacteriaceae bacterium]